MRAAVLKPYTDSICTPIEGNRDLSYARVTWLVSLVVSVLSSKPCKNAWKHIDPKTWLKQSGGQPPVKLASCIPTTSGSCLSQAQLPMMALCLEDTPSDASVVSTVWTTYPGLRGIQGREIILSLCRYSVHGVVVHTLLQGTSTSNPGLPMLCFSVPSLAWGGKSKKSDPVR